jgi:uncharacterized protein
MNETIISMNLTLDLLKETFAVAQLTARAPVPEWAKGDNFISITKTAEELSIVCKEEFIPEGVIVQKGFRCLKVRGPLDFSLVGIMAALTQPLAEAGVSVFAISTYNTDYLMLKNSDLNTAVRALGEAGFNVQP